MSDTLGDKTDEELRSMARLACKQKVNWLLGQIRAEYKRRMLRRLAREAKK